MRDHVIGSIYQHSWSNHRTRLEQIPHVLRVYVNLAFILQSHSTYRSSFGRFPLRSGPSTHLVPFSSSLQFARVCHSASHSFLLPLLFFLPPATLCTLTRASAPDRGRKRQRNEAITKWRREEFGSCGCESASAQAESYLRQESVHTCRTTAASLHLSILLILLK